MAQQGVQEVKKYTVVINAFKPDNSDLTRAITPDGEALTTHWAVGEKIYGYVNDDGAPQEVTLAAGDIDGTNNKKATLRLEFTKEGGFKDGTVEGQTADQITLYYLKPKTAYGNYSGQVGTLADIAANYDFMKATVTVTAVIPGTDEDNLLATTEANFVRQQAIAKCTIKKGSSTPLTLKGSEALTIKYGETQATVTPASDASELWVALPAADGGYRFEGTATDEKKYGASKANSLVNGKYYTTNIEMGRDAEKIELDLLSGGDPSYTGEPLSIFPLTNAEGDELTEGTDYEVEYFKKNSDTGEWDPATADDIKNAGDYKVVVTGKGDYDGTSEQEFSVEKTTTAQVETQLTSETIANETKANQGTPIDIVPDKAFGLTGAEIAGGTVESGSSITIESGDMTPNTGWATINSDGQLVTTGGGIVTVTISLPETANHEAATITKTIYVKQSGIGGGLSDPTNP